MAENLFSYTYLVGKFSVDLKPGDLDCYEWEDDGVTQKEYESLKAKYYSAHIDAMMRVEDRQVPDFLSGICHYKARLPEKEDERTVEMPVGDGREYKCTLCGIDLYFFPLDIVLFSIEIDDSGNDFDSLTNMHNLWKEWGEKYEKFKCDKLNSLLKPIVQLLPDEDVTKITADGTKIRMFQIVRASDDEVNDDLLYEIGTFSPIGVVHPTKGFKKRYLQPSEDYFAEVMKNNSVSAFHSWKALALNDSFTVLGVGTKYIDDKGEEKDMFNVWPWMNHYFPLLYLRCFFEKSFCFSRNNRYRKDKDGKTSNVERLLKEISNMERYYFYDDISYDFLPPMIYRAIKKGMNLETDLDEMSTHIKEALQEERRQRYNLMLYVVTAFAAFSVCWNWYSFVKELIAPTPDSPVFWTIFFFVLSFVLFGGCLILLYRRLLLKKNKK